MANTSFIEFDEIPADVKSVIVTVDTAASNTNQVDWDTKTSEFTVGEFRNIMTDDKLTMKKLEERIEKLEQILDEKTTRDNILF
jgi:hypothetical protein